MLVTMRSALFTVVAALLSAGCGARSPLEADPAATLGGTTATSSTTGSTTMCTPLLETGAAIVGEMPFNAADEILPSLTRRGGDSAVLAFGLRSFEPDIPSAVAHSTFAPWGAWPANLGPLHISSQVGGDSFVSSENWGTAFALAVSTGDDKLVPPLDRVVFEEHVPLGVDSDIPPQSDDPGLGEAGPGQRPWFIGRGESHYLVGKHKIEDGLFRIKTYRIPVGGTPDNVYHEMACGTSPLAGAAAGSGGGVLWAISSGAPYHECYSGVDVGPPTEVQVSWLGGDGFLHHKFDVGGASPIARIAITADGAGAWLIWQHEGTSPNLGGAIRAARTGPEGDLQLAAFSLVGEGQAAIPWAAATVGERLSLAWLDAADPALRTLRVGIFDGQGSMLGSTSITSPGPVLSDRISLLGAVDGESLVVAWATLPSGADGGARVRVVRLGCLP